MVNSVVKSVGLLALKENRLWEITAEKHFAEIKKTSNAIGGEELVGIIDSHFAKEGMVATKHTNLSFLKDPAVTAFVKAHPGSERDFLEYANQYAVIAQAKKGMHPDLVDKTIAAVDALYTSTVNGETEYKYKPGKFNAVAVFHKATDIELTDAKGLSHQLHKDNKEIPRDKAYLLAVELLEANEIPNAHKMGKGTAIHVPEGLLSTVYPAPTETKAPAKVNQK